MKKRILIVMLCLILAFPQLSHAYEIKPTLKYTNAGTYNLWTEEAYYSSPAVADIDKDGKDEIVFSNYSITVLDAVTGKQEWKVNSGFDRSTPVREFGASNGHTWSDVELADIDGDGSLEIITGHGGGVISVLSSDGYFKPGWPQKPVVASVRSVEVADLDNNGKCEIIVGYGVESITSIYVYNYDGTLRPGWPQTQDRTQAWTYGIFMDSITTGDLNNDGILEIIVPSDLSYISVFEPDGSNFPANKNVYGDKNWGQIALYEDYSTEIKGENGGWGFAVTGGESREELYKGEFGHAKAKVYDVDNDGNKEVIVTTIMCNRKYPVYPPTEYMTVALLNGDRTRYKNTAFGYNWENLPVDTGKPLFDNTESIASKVFQSPTISDIDGDGSVEILFNSYDGRVHCYSLNRREPYAWPYSLTKRTSPMYEYASPVVCEDINFDGKKDVIFTSYYDTDQGYGNVRGYLYILNYEGKLISKTQLPDSKEAGQKPNGSMAEPVVKDIDGDGAYEVIINTLQSAICVYDL